MTETHREYVAAVTLGMNDGRLANVVIVGLYGPRGGTVAAEAISVDEARGLHRALGKAIEAIEAREAEANR